MMIGKGASVGGLLLFGTTTSLISKIVYELQSTGVDGDSKFFRKPWAMTTVMFIGMTFCLPLAYYKQHQRQTAANNAEDAERPLLGEDQPHPAKHSELKEVLLLAIPTVFDLIATVLMNVGLLSVTASVYQMMRGAEMLFAALFTVVFLKRSLNKFHYMGMGCCIAGISLVGMSSLLSADSVSAHSTDSSSVLFGMLLIIASQCVQAAQITFEDFFMTDLDIDPIKIVGYEGLFGTIFMSCLLLPAVYFVPGPEGEGLHEDTLDTLSMVAGSRLLQVVLAVDMLALLAYNLSGMAVTGHLGAVFRTVLETLRTLFVWLVDLLLFYTLHEIGEAWTDYSLIQAAGFVVLVTGTLVFRRGDAVQDEEAAKLAVDEAAASESSAPPTLQHTAGSPSADRPQTTPVIVISAPTTIPGAGYTRGSEAMSVRGTPSSFRPFMAIDSSSYSRSLPRSYQGNRSSMLE